ncbi:MAG TPA: FAD/NAD(P)-binding oxidoreductase [Polyangiaceae bacterium LLY-WYZ-15_(1-7)]|nr:pyridine nucleotide-disulfide oxidoreductase [Myxococcales bacterium]MAT28938.1 pyridine nucleotide-disulfide oxidoreductase [Sandaracinus sp.]HJK93249.1 FAD/NAD(P)-binding oxidoreductase [Polyangiaceae bacterium LLY-WYZ-15_(1-7)]MBJ73068.1 pyridine nucleotide-disulfide oxidoreductase [Sandaracinus sp.]HJL00943.1 FAD/NAD(P)-binding oxidoreductase [Polyangiaceae bacterium LLY-WYZ-15_(1-7)]
MSDTHHEVLIVGGGTAGITAAAQLLQAEAPPSIAIVDPAMQHYYQPLWTLVGGGVFPREASMRAMADVIPNGVEWIRDRVAAFDPEGNAVELASGTKLTYDQLIVAPGIQLDWKKIDGLPEALGKDGVCSNYGYDTVPYTWECIRGFDGSHGGNALFTFPNTPIKCAGAPQKIMWLAEEAFRKQGVRAKANVHYVCAGAAIFGIPKYRAALEKLVDERDVHTHFKHNLVAIRPQSREAVFENLEGGDELVLKYEMIHVTPPQSAPDFVKQSPLSNDAGWVDVDKYSLQHVRYPNVFSLGDASSLPCSKTGAAVRKQAPVLVENLLALRGGKPLAARYDGYASCPLVTGYGKVILAEFGYDGAIMETFPFDQARERYSMYALKAHALPNLYWNGMLRGRM